MYGSNPEQYRHLENPLYNISNAPIYGLELGQFETGKNITYFVETSDFANNSIKSDDYYFLIN